MSVEYFLDTNILLYRYSDQDMEKRTIAANLLGENLHAGTEFTRGFAMMIAFVVDEPLPSDANIAATPLSPLNNAQYKNPPPPPPALESLRR